MPAARFGSGLNKIRKGLFSTGLAKVKAGYMYVSGAWNKVWSFGSEVSYYDGDTLIGKEDVDENRDVLHPTFTMPTKTNYTFVGWGTSNSITDWVDTLVATGEPMTLYALYVPNSNTVESGGTWNTDYASGSYEIAAASQGLYDSASGTFNINLRRYQNCSVSFWSERYTVDMQGYGHNEGASFTVDGASYSGSPTISMASGNHSYSTSAHADWVYDKYEKRTIRISSIVLSNPIAWT